MTPLERLRPSAGLVGKVARVGRRECSVVVAAVAAVAAVGSPEVELQVLEPLADVLLHRDD